jgi:archaemetzincin
MPLGELGVEVFPSIDVLASYAEAFFGMPARPIVPPRQAPVFTDRTNGATGRRQILSTDVLRWLRRGLPQDAFCAIALTTTDLYPEPGWNFVFGQASFVDRTGVFSFARYDPRFYGEKRLEGTPALVLRRSLKVMAHEIGHLFGIEHCIRFRCLMNGSNHLGETDASPRDVCPVCLRKLQHAVGFDPLARERELEAWRRAHGLVAEADRSAARIARWTR